MKTNSNLDMASESSFKCKSPDDNEITTYLGHIPRVSLWATVSKWTVSSKEETAERNPPASSLYWGPLGHNARSTEGIWELHRIELSTVNMSKIIEEFLPEDRVEKKKKIPNNLVMAYSSLQLCISISVELRSFCSWTPGFPHPRDPELLRPSGT